MKKTTRFLLTCASLALCALPALANGTFSRVDQTPQDPCSAEGKAALYTEIIPLLRTDQPKAYELAKKYVACPETPGEQTPQQKADEAQRVDYLKNKFIAPYEKAHRKDLLAEAILKKDEAGAFELGKQVFVDDPVYLKGYMGLANLGYAGSLVTNNPNAALNPDALAYANKSMQLIESGTVPASWEPFSSKDDSLSWLNYIVGFLTVEKSPNEAITSLIKAVSYDAKLKKTPHPYFFLGNAYYVGPYTKLLDDYQKYAGKDETPESKLALANVYQVADRAIDAYARAIALSGSEAQYAEIKTKAMGTATELYKVRHNQTDATGLNEVIAGILSKPLPPEPTPITTLPASAATPSPTPTGPAATPTPVKPPASSTTPSTTRATTPSRP